MRKQLWDWSNIVFSFVEIKAIYEMLVARSLSKGTVHEVLKRMLRKGLVIRRPEGYTFNPKI
ncbi:MAG: helix-turn-helix domain-containing protein, partial [Ignisphaera sp.]